MRQSPNNYPRYPHGRLSVVKHRQLAHQVGAYGAIAIKSSTGFDNMIFPKGSIFIFGSWVCEADDKANLQGRLIETLEAYEELTLPMKFTEDLTERLTVSESTRTQTTNSLDLTFGLDSPSESYLGYVKDKPSSFPIGLRNTASTLQEINSNLFQVSSKKLSRHSIGLNNMAKTYQDLLKNTAGRVRRLHHPGAQEGLILTITSKDCLIHWPGTCPLNGNAWLVEEDITLPYQEGSALHNANAPTKVINNYSNANLVTGWESFMIRQPLLIQPMAPNVRSSDESESNISPNPLEYDGKSEGQRRAR
jgi:hypothetical protein